MQHFMKQLIHIISIVSMSQSFDSLKLRDRETGFNEHDCINNM